MPIKCDLKNAKTHIIPSNVLDDTVEIIFVAFLQHKILNYPNKRRVRVTENDVNPMARLINESGLFLDRASQRPLPIEKTEAVVSAFVGAEFRMER